MTENFGFVIESRVGIQIHCSKKDAHGLPKLPVFVWFTLFLLLFLPALQSFCKLDQCIKFHVQNPVFLGFGTTVLTSQCSGLLVLVLCSMVKGHHQILWFCLWNLTTVRFFFPFTLGQWHRLVILFGRPGWEDCYCQASLGAFVGHCLK